MRFPVLRTSKARGVFLSTWMLVFYLIPVLLLLSGSLLLRVLRR